MQSRVPYDTLRFSSIKLNYGPLKGQLLTQLLGKDYGEKIKEQRLRYGLRNGVRNFAVPLPFPEYYSLIPPTHTFSREMSSS